MIDYDREHIWHPYTSMTSPLGTYPVVSAQGVRLRLEDGRELIDGMSSGMAITSSEFVRGSTMILASVWPC